MRCYSIAVLMENLHMRTIRKTLMACSLSLLLPFAASAQSLSEVQAMSKEDRRNYIESMSEDERAAMRDKWRAEYEQLPDEQKAAIRAQRQGGRDGQNRGRDRQAMQQRWDSMSEEERTAAKEKVRAKSEQRRAKWDAMSEEERAAAREKRGGQKGPGQGGHRDAGAGEANSNDEPES
jgi:hypothetical protein